MSRRVVDLTGKRFGRLTVLARAENKGGRVYWHVVCDCGTSNVVSGNTMQQGKAQSCGCYHREVARRRVVSAGEAITQDLVRSLLHYEPETGVFVWNGGVTVRQANLMKGRIAGGLRPSDGYWCIKIGRRKYAAHRLAWLYMTGELPALIDHINGERTDNRWANLRVADKSVNNHNRRGPNSTSSTGLLGAFKAQGGCFKSAISVRGKSIFLGQFDTADEAHAAYMAAKAKYHAEAMGGLS